MYGYVDLERESMVLISVLKCVGTSKLHTKASSGSNITYILNSNDKLGTLLEHLVKIWIPCICNVKYCLKNVPLVIHMFEVAYTESKSWAIHVNSHICVMGAGLLVFPEPKCLHLSTAQSKAVRDPPQQTRRGCCEQSATPGQ